MTMPHERTRSVLQTRDFLVELSRDKSLPEKIQHDAKFLLRHYPLKTDLEQAGLLEEQPERFGSLINPIFSSSTDI